jgi:hypothetical protein
MKKKGNTIILYGIFFFAIILLILRWVYPPIVESMDTQNQTGLINAENALLATKQVVDRELDYITNQLNGTSTTDSGPSGLTNSSNNPMELNSPFSQFTDSSLTENNDTGDFTQNSSLDLQINQIMDISPSFFPSFSSPSFSPSFSPSSSNMQGTGNYVLTFSINNTDISNTLELTIDSNNIVTSATMPSSLIQNADQSIPFYNSVGTVNTFFYDPDVGYNDNKLKVNEKNEYTFGESGKGGLVINVFGDKIDKTILNAKSGNYNQTSNVNSYFFNTDKNGNQKLNVYKREGRSMYVSIPQSVYNLTITKK